MINFQAAEAALEILPSGLKDIPSYMHMARHIYRSANYTKPGQYVILIRKINAFSGL